MKKLFTLIALLAVTLGAAAQTQNVYEWKDNSVTIRTTSAIDSVTFSLPDDAVSLTTGNPSVLTENSMTASFTLSTALSISNSSSTTEQGVCYSADNEEPTMSDSQVKYGTMYKGTWQATFSSLRSGMTYHYRPYLKIADAVFYGQTKSFTTLGDYVEMPEAKEYTVNGVTFKMICVEAGTFQMGSTSGYSDEQPVHSVTISKDYYIGETEVTQELWKAVMGSNPSYFTSNTQFPVEYVSWNDCQTFITKLNSLTGATFRLPTEAEWEFASRGGNKSQGYTYSGSNTVDDVAWYHYNSGSTTHAVKTKAPNELGIYDMSGNVWEWCQDWYGSYSSSAVTDPAGPTSGSFRVYRGGSWHLNATYCRCAYRGSSTPTNAGNGLGLRLASQ